MFKAHTALNKALQLVEHIRAKMGSMRSEELPEELRVRTVAGYRAGQGWKHILLHLFIIICCSYENVIENEADCSFF